MPHSHQEYHHLYQGKIFWWVFLSFASVGILGSVVMFYARSSALFRDTQETLREIAVNAAQLIPSGAHELFVNSSQESSDAYQSIAERLRYVIAGNSDIDDIYTLRPTSQTSIFSFVVSAQETNDENGNGIIEAQEEKAHIGETYDAKDFPELAAGLNGPSADAHITYDKWGSWLSGYAPLRDDHGRAIAIVGVDFSASTISAQQSDLLRVIAVANAMILPLMLLAAYLISLWLGRPLRILAEGMDRVAHGETRYRLPLRGHGAEAVIAQLFNNMLNNFNPGERPHRPENSRSAPPEV